MILGIFNGDIKMNKNHHVMIADHFMKYEVNSSQRLPFFPRKYYLQYTVP